MTFQGIERVRQETDQNVYQYQKTRNYYIIFVIHTI